MQPHLVQGQALSGMYLCATCGRKAHITVPLGRNWDKNEQVLHCGIATSLSFVMQHVSDTESRQWCQNCTAWWPIALDKVQDRVKVWIERSLALIFQRDRIYAV
jgi:hypothetical protein